MSRDDRNAPYFFILHPVSQDKHAFASVQLQQEISHLIQIYMSDAMEKIKYFHWVKEITANKNYGYKL